VVLDQLILVLAVCATGGAALRVTSSIAASAPGSRASGSAPPVTSIVERTLVAVTVAATFLVCWTLALGVVGLSGSLAALAAGPFVAWAATRWLVPAPPRSILAELIHRWDGASRTQRVAALTLAGVAAGCVAQVARQPGFGVDALEYHLPDAIGWLHSGHAGAVQSFSYEFPVGYYPITNEVLLTWMLGISRSFAPLGAWSTLMAALALLAVWRLLELLRAPRPVAGAALAALATLPVLLMGLNGMGPGTDLPAVTWLACTAALSAGAAARPALLGPALLAAGLGVGTKTTVAPLALAALLAGAWRARHELRLTDRWPLAGVAGGVLAGGPWFVRNTLTHGWPLWPFSSGPTGDPLPRAVSLFHVSFLSRPAATLSLSPSFYLKSVAGGAVLVLGALAVSLLTRSRAARLWGALALASVLAWAVAPFTGVSRYPLLAPLALTAVRYLLAPFGACAVALAIGARDASSTGRRLAIGVFAAATVASVIADVSLGYPDLPRLRYLLAGALAGAALGAVSTWSRLRLAPAGLRLAGALLAGLALIAAAPGWLGREAQDGSPNSPVLSFMLSQPGFRSGGEPIGFAPAVLGTLAGPALRHPISLIGAREPCERVRARLLRGWIVVRPAEFAAGISTPFDAPTCLRGYRPIYDDGATFVYARASAP